MRSKEMTIGTNVNNNFSDGEEDDGYLNNSIEDKQELNADFIKYQGTVPFHEIIR